MSRGGKYQAPLCRTVRLDGECYFNAISEGVGVDDYASVFTCFAQLRLRFWSVLSTFTGQWMSHCQNAGRQISLKVDWHPQLQTCVSSVDMSHCSRKASENPSLLLPSNWQEPHWEDSDWTARTRHGFNGFWPRFADSMGFNGFLARRAAVAGTILGTQLLFSGAACCAGNHPWDSTVFERGCLLDGPVSSFVCIKYSASCNQWWIF